MAQALQAENGLPTDYYQYLLTGGTGLQKGTPDTRISNVYDLPPGPFQLTNATTHPYDVYDNSPVHRFYQMWQQLDCNASFVTTAEPSGCNADLFPWVEVTVGAGTNGTAQPGELQQRRRPAKARPPWASTTCSRATRPT